MSQHAVTDCVVSQALVPVGALLSCSVVGVLSDWIGWKKVMVVSGFPNAIGWIMIIASPYMANPHVFKWMILSGRFLTGIATGWLCAVAPVSYKVRSSQLMLCVWCCCMYVCVCVCVCVFVCVTSSLQGHAILINMWMSCTPASCILLASFPGFPLAFISPAVDKSKGEA